MSSCLFFVSREREPDELQLEVLGPALKKDGGVDFELFAPDGCPGGTLGIEK